MKVGGGYFFLLFFFLTLILPVFWHGNDSNADIMLVYLKPDSRNWQRFPGKTTRQDHVTFGCEEE